MVPNTLNFKEEYNDNPTSKTQSLQANFVSKVNLKGK